MFEEEEEEKEALDVAKEREKTATLEWLDDVIHSEGWNAADSK